MKEHPILFSTPMVQAIIAGRKTQTRRTKGLEAIPNDTEITKYVYKGIPTGLLNTHSFARMWKGNWAETIHISCPYGEVGDVLWVRETWQQRSENAIQMGFEKYFYKAGWAGCTDAGWKPSIHMPKEACRLFLRIKSIKVERLQDITEEDAIAEGIMPLAMSGMQMITTGQLYYDYGKTAELFNDGLRPRKSFQSLWQSINEPESWLSNPWVWVIEFERI